MASSTARFDDAEGTIDLNLALADELVSMSQILSDLAYDLGMNPVTIRAHMASLQTIDRLTQAQLAIADVLRSQEPIASRVQAITLESLATNLRHRLRIPSQRD